MSLKMRHVTDLGGGNYKVRMTVAPSLVPIIGMRNLTRNIKEPDTREARAKLQQIIAEFEMTLADARAEFRGSALEWVRIKPPSKLEFCNLDAETATAIRELILGKYPELAGGVIERGGLGTYVHHQRSDSPAPARNSVSPREPVTFESIIETWIKENKPREGSIKHFRGNMQQLGRWLGHTNMTRITREKLIEYKEYLLDVKKSITTVKNHLLVIKTLFAFAFNNGKIAINPAAQVPTPSADSDRRPFTEEERRLILTEARKAEPVIRWTNWISHFNGARLSEITEAHKRDIEVMSDIVVLRIRKDNRTAGQDVKTKPSIRRVPLHSAIIREGFLGYWNSIPDGSLFPNPKKLNRSRVMGEWLRGIGITDRNAVFHSHRHSFIDLAREMVNGEMRIPIEPRRAITGHANGAADADYGIFPISTLAALIERIPDPTVSRSAEPVSVPIQEAAE
jgi:integrase